MNKNITIKRETPCCELTDLKGRKGSIEAYWINDISDIEPTLELGYACTCADNNGCINVWKNDKNEICAELSKFRFTVKERIFDSYNEMEECIREWIEEIK